MAHHQPAAPSMHADRDNEWTAYYHAFDYFSPGEIRPGCHPRCIEDPGGVEHAVVLVHGLSDSPYYMTAIGDHFARRLGFNVYMPLLQSHGLVKPRGMADVRLEEWKRNVAFAIECAARHANEISIGGLSTGGTLALYDAVNDGRINGAVYLFSAALDLAGGLAGNLKERLLRTPLAKYLDRDKPLIGANPYRYSHVDVGGARQLSRLLKETDAIMKSFSRTDPFSKRVFAAHSECDETANISAIERLRRHSYPENFTFFRMPKDRGISHASVVLQDPVYAVDAKPGDDPLERANPLFGAMLEALTAVATGDSTP